MIKLFIRQDDPLDGSYPIRLTLKRDGQPDVEAEAKIKFALTDQEQNDLRWYLEDYLQHAGEAEIIVAQQVESLIQARGEELYQTVLGANENTRALWYSIRNDVADLRVEVATGIAEAASIPWELMRDPKLNSPISLRTKSFVRVQLNPNISFVPIPKATDGRVRLLYIASRPGGASDVELRAVANRLVHDLGQERSRFDIKALRPPTFERLQEELNDARQADRPYHIVHFDGHGTYQDLSNTKLGHWVGKEDGERGYLLFEHPGEGEVRPIVGEALGKLLHDCGVPVLVLNACQSAMHENRGKANSALDVHDEVRAIGSLAQAVIDQGVPAVLGMRYSVFVVTAAQYIGALYKALAKGRSFGHAATEGRKHLQLNPERWVGLEPHPLQDWFVPIAYEATPVELLATQQSMALGEEIELDPVQNNRALLRYVPEEGFIGRDETLLAVDRAFDNHRVVLLHAYAGQGKSSTAVEFARWYSLTGGLGSRPVVLLASFEAHTDLDDLLNQIAQTFSLVLEREGIHWSALNEPEKRRSVVVQILRLFPILWIWDNVEPVAGFPDGSESQWTTDEQNELRDFLKQIKFDSASKARILLTSRREEQKWLGGIPYRIQMLRMRNSDAARLALTLGREKNLAPSEVATWQPLLDYCSGNPLTLRVLVGQAVRAKLKGRRQIEEFVEAIRSGEQQIEDVDEEQGRDKSLGASLNYGFQSAFKEDELPIIALLHLFQGTVDGDVLHVMGVGDWALPELAGKDKKELTRLLQRANEIGVLTRIGPSYFTIHPALPWFLKQQFVKYYDGVAGRSSAETALRSWVEALGVSSNFYFKQFHELGNRNVIAVLEFEKANLLDAWKIARAYGWSTLVISCMQGLLTLSDYQGHFAEFAGLVDKVRLEYCTPDDEPLPGKEDQYSIFMGYRVKLATQYDHNIHLAVNLQTRVVNFDRKRAGVVSELPLDTTLNKDQHYLLLVLGIAVAKLAQLRADMGAAACVLDFQEAINIYRRLGGRAGEAIAEWNLGNAYKGLAEIRDLDAAEAAFKRSLDLHGEDDLYGRSKCIRQIGLVYYERWLEAAKRGDSTKVWFGYLQAAEDRFLEALKLCPANAIADLAVIHNNLGALYSDVAAFDKARMHYEVAAQLDDRIGNRHGAGRRRFNLALTYVRTAQIEKEPSHVQLNLNRARAYAEAALRDFEFYGTHAASDQVEIKRLLKDLNEALAAIHGITDQDA